MVEKYILYLDTSDREAQIALYCGQKKVAEERWEAFRSLSLTLSQKYLLIIKEASITASDLAGVAVFVGPGSFTGLRIGVSFANGLAFGLGMPIYGIKEKGVLSLLAPQKVVQPIYGAEPHITTPKKS